MPGCTIPEITKDQPPKKKRTKYNGESATGKIHTIHHMQEKKMTPAMLTLTNLPRKRELSIMVKMTPAVLNAHKRDRSKRGHLGNPY